LVTSASSTIGIGSPALTSALATAEPGFGLSGV